MQIKKTIHIFFILFLITVQFLEGKSKNLDQSREIKTLILIIASDNMPVYRELQKIWSAYMNLDPKHFEVYFIRGNPSLSSHEIVGNDLIVNSEESYKPGIINKTVLSIEALLPRLNEFDFVIRTNLSSFYSFPRLLKYLKTLPKVNCYSGVVVEFMPDWGLDGVYRKFVSGAGIIMSTDVAKMLVNEKDVVLEKSETLSDDVIIADFLQSKGVPLINANRTDIRSLFLWYQDKHTIPEEAFHFRAKAHVYERSISENCNDEILINQDLLKMFYSITLNDLNLTKTSDEVQECGMEVVHDQTILLGALIKNNDKLIPSFLKSLDRLKYNKGFIHLDIADCNEDPVTKKFIQTWIEENRLHYGQITYTNHTANSYFSSKSDWERDNILATIKNDFLGRAKNQECDYCFIVESDVFLAPCTLTLLIDKNKPIISPLLKPFPNSSVHYRNFYVDVTENGYHKYHPDNLAITYNQKIGSFPVKMVNGVYLIQSKYLDLLTFKDKINDWGILSFCRSANKNQIDQYICNEQNFGYFLLHNRELTAEEKTYSFLGDDFDFYEYLFRG